MIYNRPRDVRVVSLAYVGNLLWGLSLAYSGGPDGLSVSKRKLPKPVSLSSPTNFPEIPFVGN